MPQKLKKILASFVLCLQISAAIGLGVANVKLALADDQGVDVVTGSDAGAPPASDQSSSSGETSESSPKSSSKSYSSQSFSVRYLKTTDQNSSYLNSNSPIASFVIMIINFLATTIGSLAFLSVIIGGFILLASNGNETMLTKGKDIITMAIIGLIIALSAYFITSFVQSIFYELPKT